MFKKIIIRCDAAELDKIGTGHLYRSITIYEFLKKKLSLKKNNILFLVKSFGKYNIAKKILLKNNINFHTIKNNISDYSNKELSIINNFRSNLIIIDRWGSTNKNFIIGLRSNHKKIILIDDGSANRIMADLSINPLKVFCKRVKGNYIGYKYNILPVLGKRLNKSKSIDKRLVFISFGGFDANNLVYKCVRYLANKGLNLKFLVNEKYQKKLKNTQNTFFFRSRDHYKNLSKSNIVITAGGLSMFDAVYLNKKTICIPQHSHQIKNINILNKKKVVYKVNVKNLKKLYSTLRNLSEEKTNKIIHVNQKKIINYSFMQNTLNLFYKCYGK